MNRLKKIIAIFYELKATIGEFQSDKELLSAAHQILGAYEKKDVRSPANIRLRENKDPIEYRDLSEAFEDGGWQVMHYETTLMNDYYADEKDEISERVLIDHLFSGVGAAA